MATSVTHPEPLRVLPTVEQHRLLTEAAAKQHRSLDSFVLEAALRAASETIDVKPGKPRRSREEVRAIIEAARAEVRAANPTNRDILAEFLAERRAEAARE